MALSLTGIDWDALDPLRLARFWSELLGRDSIGANLPDDGSGFGIRFVQSSEPKTLQNRIHFDLTTTSADEMEATVARVIELGGRHVDVGQRADERHVVLADPEGNELCVIPSDNTFLADTALIGAVNCDGTRDLGRFWSAALEWPLVWEQDEETAIQSPLGGSKFTWSGPPLMPRGARDRIRLVVSAESGDLRDAVATVLSLGATGDAGSGVLKDPDGNEFRLTARS